MFCCDIYLLPPGIRVQRINCVVAKALFLAPPIQMLTVVHLWFFDIFHLPSQSSVFIFEQGSVNHKA